IDLPRIYQDALKHPGQGVTARDGHSELRTTESRRGGRCDGSRRRAPESPTTHAHNNRTSVALSGSRAAPPLRTATRYHVRPTRRGPLGNGPPAYHELRL